MGDAAVLLESQQIFGRIPGKARRSIGECREQVSADASAFEVSRL